MPLPPPVDRELMHVRTIDLRRVKHRHLAKRPTDDRRLALPIQREHLGAQQADTRTACSTSADACLDNHLPSASVGSVDAKTSKSVKGSSSGPNWKALLKNPGPRRRPRACRGR